MQTSLTVFHSIYDNKTNKRMDFKSFSEFEKLLYQLSEKTLFSKKDAPLISPATYKPSSLRRNVNVLDWGGWAALDVDSWKTNDFREEMKSKFSGIHFVCYSTASSTQNHPKFRIVFPLTRRVKTDKIRQFWFALNTFAGSIGDVQVKDYARMYYVPADYRVHEDQNNFIFTQTGRPIDVDDLIERYPLPKPKSSNFLDNLPEDVQRQIIEHRKTQLTNETYNWTSYHDCPFVNKRLVDEYKAISQIDGTGRYHMIYRIMCSIANAAISKKYPITPSQISDLIRQIDLDTSRKYQNRPLEIEAERALEFSYKNS